jgi:hypothetical protein
MREVAIQKIYVDPNGRVRLRPTPTVDYSFIWRDATSVRWDSSTGELYVLEIPCLDAIAEFKKMKEAVKREYGDELILLPSTEYDNIPVDLAVAMQTAD